jgi:hypothetical protein
MQLHAPYSPITLILDTALPHHCCWPDGVVNGGAVSFLKIALRAEPMSEFCG